MSKIRRVDFSPDEWIAGTRDLELDERGAYWDVCSLMYSRGGPVADDESWLARALGCHVRTWRKIRARLLALGKLRIVVIDGADHLTNGRAERELGRAFDRIDTAHKAAEESARKRRERVDRDAREGRGEVDSGSRDGRGFDQNQGDLLNNKGLADAPATPASLSQPSTINHQPINNTESLTAMGSAAEGAAPAEAKTKRAARLPEGWSPSDKARAWTIQKIRDEQAGVSAGHELEKFRNYYAAKTGKGSTSPDWDAKWRTWILNAITYERRDNGSSTTQRTHQGGRRAGSAIRTAANFAAALGGHGGGRPGEPGRDTDAERMETASVFDPAGTARKGT